MKLYIYGIVGDSWDGLDAKTIAGQLEQAQDGETINVHINSPGGYVTEGLAILNLLQAKVREGFTVACHVDGLAASMASIIALGGQTMTMAKNALYMIHNPWNVAIGDAPELRREADRLDKMKALMVDIYSTRSSFSPEDVAALMDAETWFNATEAKDGGFATHVEEPVTASGHANRNASAWKNKIEGFGFNKMPDLQAVLGALALGAAPTPAAVAAIPPKGKEMSHPTPPAAPNPAEPTPALAITQADIDAVAKTAADAAVAAERQRNIQIKDAVAKAGLTFAFAETLIASGKSIDAARVDIIDELAKGSDAARIGHSAPVQIVADEVDKFAAGAQAWMFQKAGVAGIVAQAAKMRGETVDLNPGEFRGARNADLARRSLELHGHRVSAVTPDAIVRQAIEAGARGEITQTTGDFTVLLENTMNKILKAAYATTPDTWSRICGIGTATDFRPNPRYRKGTFGSLDALTEAGEFKNKAIPDGAKEVIQLATKGNIINLSRQAIVNDDMDVFAGMAVDLGRAAKLTIELDFYALLAANPVMQDGVTFFHASHGNIATGAAPSVAAFDAMRVLIASQKDVSGNEVLDYTPGVGLFPMSLGGTARVINGSEYDPDTANKLQRRNMVYGMLNDIVDTARLSGTAYYMFIDPAILPAFEVLFLNGEQEPFLDTMDGWRVDGVEWKVREDYAVGAVDWRAAASNAGA